MKRFVLIDGHSLLFRAYHALPKTFTDKEGNPINAVYGFASMLIKVVADLKPDYLVVAFDEKGPTFRHADLVTYKEGRPEMDNEMVVQLPIVRDLLTSFSIPIASIEGYEGEDIIATIVAKVRSRRLPESGRACLRLRGSDSRSRTDPGNLNGVEFYIVSGDRDVLQLVDEKVSVYAPKKGISEAVVYTPSNVEEVFGVRADQITDFKGLRGDQTDRIPGVFGIGEKTAAALIEKFGTIENLYRRFGEVRKDFGERVAEKLMVGAEQAVLSKKLATIARDAPLTVEAEDFRCQDFKDNREGLDFLRSLNFRSLIKRITGEETGRENSKKKKKKAVEGDQPRLL